MAHSSELHPDLPVDSERLRQRPFACACVETVRETVGENEAAGVDAEDYVAEVELNEPPRFEIKAVRGGPDGEVCLLGGGPGGALDSRVTDGENGVAEADDRSDGHDRDPHAVTELSAIEKGVGREAAAALADVVDDAHAPLDAE